MKLKSYIALLSLSLAGCVPPGRIYHGSYTVVGIRVGQAASGAYEMNIGLTRAQADIVPVGTNMYAPAVTSKLNLKAKLTSTDITDDYSTGGATREFTVAAQQPKPAQTTNSVTVHANGTNTVSGSITNLIKVNP